MAVEPESDYLYEEEDDDEYMTNLNEVVDQRSFLDDEQLTYLATSLNRSVTYWSQSFILNSAWLTWKMGVTCGYGFVFILGLCANLWSIKRVLVTMINSKRCAVNKATPSVLVYIFSLSLLNLLVLTLVPIAIVEIVLGRWPFGQYMCQFYWTVETMNKNASSLILSFLTVSCYCAVCRREMKKLYDSSWCAGLHVVVAVVLVLFMYRSIVTETNVYHLVEKNPNDSTLTVIETKCLLKTFNDPDVLLSFTVCSFVCGYVIPLLTMIVCYSLILLEVRSTRLRRKQRFRRVAISVFVIVCFYLASWTPYWTMTLILSFTSFSLDQSRVTFFTVAFVMHMLPYVNCACSTSLYTLLNGKIRTSKRRAII